MADPLAQCLSDLRTVLVALDGSRRAEAALSQALSLATSPRARLLLVQAVRARALPGEDGERRRQLQCGVARTYLAAVAARVHARWPALRVGVAVPLGPAAEAIVDEAALSHADVIVLATHGLGTAPWHSLGRTAAEVLRRAEVPVLVVPTRRREPAGTGPEPAGTGPEPVVAPPARAPARAPDEAALVAALGRPGRSPGVSLVGAPTALPSGDGGA